MVFFQSVLYWGSIQINLSIGKVQAAALIIQLNLKNMCYVVTKFLSRKMSLESNMNLKVLGHLIHLKPSPTNVSLQYDAIWMHFPVNIFHPLELQAVRSCVCNIVFSRLMALDKCIKLWVGWKWKVKWTWGEWTNLMVGQHVFSFFFFLMWIKEHTAMYMSLKFRNINLWHGCVIKNNVSSE